MGRVGLCFLVRLSFYFGVSSGGADGVLLSSSLVGRGSLQMGQRSEAERRRVRQLMQR